MVRTKKQDSTDNAKGNLWTVGHSNRTLEVFIDVLQAERIEILADVRSFPSSRRHPQFDRKEVEEGLSRVRISYHWLGKQLGGYRSGARVNNPHIALQRPGLRAYADYMESGDFQSGIKQLLDISREGRTVYMCAEKLWWECHRSPDFRLSRRDPRGRGRPYTGEESHDPPFTQPACASVWSSTRV